MVKTTAIFINQRERNFYILLIFILQMKRMSTIKKLRPNSKTVLDDRDIIKIGGTECTKQMNHVIYQ